MPEGRLARTRAKYPPEFWRPTRSTRFSPLRKESLCPQCGRGASRTVGGMWACGTCRIHWLPQFAESFARESQTFRTGDTIVIKPSWQGRAEQVAAELQGCDCKALDSDLGCAHTERIPSI